MVETKNKDEPVLPSKRKLGPLPSSENNEGNQSNKYQKPQFLTNNGIIAPNEEKASPTVNSASNFSVAEEQNGSKAQAEKNAVREVDGEEEEEDDTDFEDVEDDENGKAASEADRKGKGIMIEEEDDESDDDDSDNSSDGGSEADSDCNELEDDPLAEVDLDNILPSRTRRRAMQPGFYIVNDLGNNQDDNSDG